MHLKSRISIGEENRLSLSPSRAVGCALRNTQISIRSQSSQDLGPLPARWAAKDVNAPIMESLHIGSVELVRGENARARSYFPTSQVICLQVCTSGCTKFGCNYQFCCTGVSKGVLDVFTVLNGVLVRN